MLRITLDTCVLVSAFKSNQGASYALLQALPSRRFEFAVSLALYTEWRSVLTRAEHLPHGVSIEKMLSVLQSLLNFGHFQDIHFLWRPYLRDPNDDMVLECAMASSSRYIVSHNVKDFRKSLHLGIPTITPSEFLTLLSRHT